MQYWLVMPAAGTGRRFGSAKQYAPLAGSTVLETALRLFVTDSRCAGGSLVLSEDDPNAPELAARLAPRFRIVAGGPERVHSVANGLAALTACASPTDWVLVHDAARPCLSRADLARLLEHAVDGEVGALLALPVADTLKRAAMGPEGARIAETLSRETLWLAQTPQMFRLAALAAALGEAIAARRTPTDEAQAMEWQGARARLVSACDSNFKITNAADLALAEAILAARSSRCG